MRIVSPSFEILRCPDGLEALRAIERAARTCYKSEDRITDESCVGMVRSLIRKGHDSTLEFADMTVLFVCDRGLSHAFVRHRLASFEQESTQYCSYAAGKFGGEIAVVCPERVAQSEGAFQVWRAAMEAAEQAYMALLAQGHAPQTARAVLPTAVKTELVMKANMREWRHFFRLRTSAADQWEIQSLATRLLLEAQRRVPVLFDDIVPATGHPVEAR